MPIYLIILLLNLTAMADVHDIKIVRPFNLNYNANQKLYGCKEKGISRGTLNEIFRQLPTPTTLILNAVNSATIDFADSDATKIASSCKKEFKIIHQQIVCVSKAIHDFFYESNFSTLNSSCLSHAYAFNKAFSKLAIPRSSSSMLHIEGKFYTSCEQANHTLNRITLVSENGQPYTYAIDSGWFPGELFPLTQSTIDFHMNNSSFPNLNDRKNCNSYKLPQSGLLELLNKLVKGSP